MSFNLCSSHDMELCKVSEEGKEKGFPSASRSALSDPLSSVDRHEGRGCSLYYSSASPVTPAITSPKQSRPTYSLAMTLDSEACREGEESLGKYLVFACPP